MTGKKTNSPSWLFRIRLLIVIYLLVIPIAIWESFAVTNEDESSPLALSETRLSAEPELTAKVAEVSSALYPNRMQPHYWRGFNAFQGALYEDAQRHFRAGIAVNPKDE